MIAPFDVGGIVKYADLLKVALHGGFCRTLTAHSNITAKAGRPEASV
jgi:hypothetical protein